MKNLTNQQLEIVTEFTSEYGVDHDEIIFFDSSPRPWFQYEAACAILAKLVPIREILAFPVNCPQPDSVAAQCSIILPDGPKFSSFGVVNLAEQIQGEPISNIQAAYGVATARAIRATLRAADIDLVALHYQRVGKPVPGSERFESPKSNRAALLARVHKLGHDLGLLSNASRSEWAALLRHRYGVSSSGELSDFNLADFASWLSAKSANPSRRAA